MLSYCEYYGTTDTSSFEDFEELLVLIFASAICYTLWRIFVTNRSGPRGGVVALGLDDSSCVYSDLGVKGVSGYLRLLYFAVSILTFLIGVMTYEGLKFVSEEYYGYW